MATASSDGVVLVFDPSMSGECRAPSTGSDIRDRCREFVIKALKKGFTEGEKFDAFLLVSTMQVLIS